MSIRAPGTGKNYYRFRCKYFLIKNCDNWVWVAQSACTQCVAAGLEAGDLPSSDPCLPTRDGMSPPSPDTIPQNTAMDDGQTVESDATSMPQDQCA